MQATAVKELKKTAMYEQHLAAKANIVDFSGWQMPLHYGSQIAEHNAVREDAGVFDVSHMAVVDITGKDSNIFLKKVLANNIDKLKQPGCAIYGCMLNHNGGVIDDLITYYIAEEYYRLIVNAGTFAKDFAWLKQQASDFNIELKYQDSLSILAIQGPQAIAKTKAIFSEDTFNKVTSLKPFRFTITESMFIAKTGYTGEPGIEVVLEHDKAVKLWQNLIQAGVAPIGLGARDTLRIEAGFNLYGTDMDENVTPLESNLAWTVAFEPTDRDFIGRDALKKQLDSGVKQNLIALILEDRGVLRSGQKVFINDTEVGYITSGTFSPTLKKSIAFARVKIQDLDNYLVEIRGKKLKAIATKLPFVSKQKK